MCAIKRAFMEGFMTYNIATTALTTDQLRRLAEAAKVGIARRGVDFFAWRNAPEVDASVGFRHPSGWGESAITREVSAEEALPLNGAKPDGAHGERFALCVAL